MYENTEEEDLESLKYLGVDHKKNDSNNTDAWPRWT